MYCPKCGTKNVDDAVFCFRCGADLKKLIPQDAGSSEHKQVISLVTSSESASLQGEVETISQAGKNKKPLASQMEGKFVKFVKGMHGLNSFIEQWRSIISGVFAVGSAVGAGNSLIKPSLIFPSLSGGICKLNIMLDIGLLTAIFYGISWSLIELIRKWDYGAGGGEKSPEGISAILLSFTLTIPLVFVPVGFQWLIGIHLVQPRHLIGGIVIIFFGALGHLIMYGTGPKTYAGLRAKIAKTSVGALNTWRFFIIEIAFIVVYFLTIVVPYRMIVLSSYPLLKQLSPFSTLSFMGLFFFGVVAFDIVKYRSLNDKRWLQAKGIVAGILLPIALCLAMYS